MEHSSGSSFPGAGRGEQTGKAAAFIVPAVIGGIVFLAFAPVLWNGFVNWDDDANLTGNEGYRGLTPPHLWWMITTFHMGNYQPLTWLSLAIDFELWGMNPAGYHLTSLLLHLASALLFYRVLLDLLERIPRGEDARARESIRLPAAIGALLFALHPLRVESVAWATERKDVLCGFFTMLTLLAYLRMDREERAGRPATRWRVLSVAFFAASLLSKALGLMLPLVLLALDVYPLGRWAAGRRTKILLEKIPFIGLAALEGILTYQAIGQAGLIRTVAALQPGDRLLQSGYGLGFYLWKSLLPLHLCALYPAPHSQGPWPPASWLILLGVAAITLACVLGRRRFPAVGMAWFCYAALLLPVLGLVNDAPHWVADRYSYLACLPWAVLGTFAVDRMSARAGLVGATAIIVPLAVIPVLGTLTFVQSSVWKDSISLWNQALRVDDRNPSAYNNRGIARAARHDAPGALRDFTEAVRLDPDFVEAYYNRGRLKSDSGDLDGAIQDETEAIRLCPDYSRAYRGRSLDRRAKGDASGADADLAQAVRIETASPPSPGILGATEPVFSSAGASEIQSLNNEGNRRASLGDFQAAIDLYTKAISLDPTVPGIFNNRGNARASKGDQSGAVADYSEALRLDPGFAEAFANRGLSRAILGNLEGAREDYTEALRFTPRDADVLANRGIVRKELGDPAGARADLETALAVAPSSWARIPVVRSLLFQLQGR
jgi:tetratricopeptide (TPR) repeat protein